MQIIAPTRNKCTKRHIYQIWNFLKHPADFDDVTLKSNLGNLQKGSVYSQTVLGKGK